MLRTFEQLADTFVTAIIPFYALGVAAIFPLRKKAGYKPAVRALGYPVVPIIFVASDAVPARQRARRPNGPGSRR